MQAGEEEASMTETTDPLHSQPTDAAGASDHTEEAPPSSESSESFDTAALLAIGLVADSLTAAAIARYAKVHAADARAAIDEGIAEGVIGPDGTVEASVRARLIADLPVEVTAGVHAEVARHLMAAGPERMLDAVRHARAAGTLVPLEEIVQMADRAGRLSLAMHDYASALELFKVAGEFDISGDNRVAADRLIAQAASLDGLGRVSDSRDLLARAAALAEVADDNDTFSRAAVSYALPVDWYAGDPRAAALLKRADERNLTIEQRTVVTAARALVEMRIPIGGDESNQTAWVTRPTVAHALADEAMARSEGLHDMVRCFALQAWRATHRAPGQLARRREVSSDALDHAQRLRYPTLQLESAVWLAVDGIESGDRPMFDEALSVARWVAERNGNPRLRWRAYTLAAGAAHLDAELDEAKRFRALAAETGQSISSPGWLGADLLLYGEELIADDDVDTMERVLAEIESIPIENPIGKAVVARLQARTGSTEEAEALVRRALRQLDPESSYLLLSTRLAHVVEELGSRELAGELIGVLGPWHAHVAVDSNGWWIDGPVAGWLARLHHVRGEIDAVRHHLDEAEPLAHAINDVRSLRRIAELRQELRAEAGPGAVGVTMVESDPVAALLTERERRVLELLAAGQTNKQIAETLSFSLGTIRADTVTLYRKLGAKGRVDAVAQALATGLLVTDS